MARSLGIMATLFTQKEMKDYLFSELCFFIALLRVCSQHEANFFSFKDRLEIGED